jgi:L-iditol 2-dehydrogenase
VRALVSERPGTPVLKEVPLPEPGPGEVLVRVRAALTCGTDLKIARRGHPKFPFPLTLGHEWAGVVEKSGPGVSWRAGTRVTSAVSAPCGTCGPCRAGRENFCETAFDRPLFGAFADFLLVPPQVVTSGLREIPDGMPDEAAALLDPLASAVHAVGRVRDADAAGQDVLITGTGPMAALLFLLLKGKDDRAAARRIVVAGRRKERLFFFERKGAEIAFIAQSASNGGTNAPAPLPLFTFKEISSSPSSCSSSPSFSLVIDTTGDPGVIEALPALAADGGTVLLFAGLPGGMRVAIDAHAVHYREVSVLGSFHYTPREADEALSLLASGAIPAAEIVSARRPLAAWEDAFELASAGTVLKVAVIP